ncbi:MAG: tetratricopeptide repeat protein [Thermodesulfovibrionales bacterium]|jgi:predicted O-linked N-acetylglucosamine transferase (SPINDLY family)
MNIGKAIQLLLNHYREGDLHQAEHTCKEILKVQPRNAEILHFLAIICAELEKHDSSIQYFKRSLQFNKNNADAYLALGILMQKKGLMDEAISYFQNAIALNPSNVEAYNNMGSALNEKGQLDEAITCYQKAIEISPSNADIYHNLAISFQAKGLIDESIKYYQKAIQINPNLQATYNNLGVVFQSKGQLDEAINCYQKALMIDPNFAEAYFHLGNVQQWIGKREEALSALDNAIKIKPNFIIARWAKCISQLPIVYPDQSSIAESRKLYHKELIKLKETIHLETPQDIKDAAEAVGVKQPFYLAYQGFDDRELQQLYGELVCKIMSYRYPQFSVRPIMPILIHGTPLRVGIVSGYFHDHPVWKIIIKGWIENFDKNKINLYGYYTGKKKDTETEKARTFFAKFIEDSYSFEDFCRTISNDNLHVIIYPEIGMDSTTVKLAALRLAPIQCTSWGHPDTSGLPTIDYYLSGELMETPDSDTYYTERLIRLPNLSIHYTPQEFSSIGVTREMFGLQPKSILYHCCQALFKFLPQYDVVFPRIAQQVGNCQFLFSSLPESVFLIEQFRMRIYRVFKQFDLNANDYVIFLPHLDSVKYNALNRLCNIFLDPIGWSGCTSTLEALDCNLPVIAFPYFLMRGRESTAILNMMGLKETIATSIDDYVSLAVKLGKDSNLRSQISDKIARKKHIVYQDITCIAALEDFLEAVVKEKLKNDL